MSDKEKNKDFFAYGDEAYEEERKRQEELAKEREAARVASLRTFPLWLRKDESKNVVFFHVRPIMYYAHDIKYSRKQYDGSYKETFGTLPCMIKPRGECIKCAEGDTPKVKIAYVILDLSSYEVDGVTYNGGTIRPFIRPFGDAPKFKRLFSGELYESQQELTDENVFTKTMKVIRDGEGVNTTYSLIPAHAVKLNEEQNKRLKEFQEKYPEPTEYVIKWIEADFQRMMEELGHVEKPEFKEVDESNTEAVVTENDLPF